MTGQGNPGSSGPAEIERYVERAVEDGQSCSRVAVILVRDRGLTPDQAARVLEQARPIEVRNRKSSVKLWAAGSVALTVILIAAGIIGANLREYAWDGSSRGRALPFWTSENFAVIQVFAAVLLMASVAGLIDALIKMGKATEPWTAYRVEVACRSSR